MTIQDDAADTVAADSSAVDDSASASLVPVDEKSCGSGACPTASPGRPKGIIDNLPYIAMILLGSAIFLVGLGDGLWHWLAAGSYLFYGAAGAVWVKASAHDMAQCLDMAVGNLEQYEGIVVEGNSSIEVLNPDIKKGWYEVPVCARRHLVKPLKRMIK